MGTLLSTVVWLLLSLISLSLSTTVPSSCIGEDDGYQWLKMIDDDDYPAVYQKCDNEYMVIDLYEDPNVQNYFSSFTSWHYALSGLRFITLIPNTLRVCVYIRIVKLVLFRSHLVTGIQMMHLRNPRNAVQSRFSL